MNDPEKELYKHFPITRKKDEPWITAILALFLYEKTAATGIIVGKDVAASLKSLGLPKALEKIVIRRATTNLDRKFFDKGQFTYDQIMSEFKTRFPDHYKLGEMAYEKVLSGEWPVRPPEPEPEQPEQPEQPLKSYPWIKRIVTAIACITLLFGSLTATSYYRIGPDILHGIEETQGKDAKIKFILQNLVSNWSEQDYGTVMAAIHALAWDEPKHQQIAERMLRECIAQTEGKKKGLAFYTLADLEKAKAIQSGDSFKVSFGYFEQSLKYFEKQWLRQHKAKRGQARLLFFEGRHNEAMTLMNESKKAFDMSKSTSKSLTLWAELYLYIGVATDDNTIIQTALDLLVDTPIYNRCASLGFAKLGRIEQARKYNFLAKKEALDKPYWEFNLVSDIYIFKALGLSCDLEIEACKASNSPVIRQLLPATIEKP